ncbi:MAG TPA: hypothetical protein VKV18_04160 [Chthonomonas sp.]|uniref:hypothetical protein n=1 Tax=Chthonomonas sp. TaxID=2282153 RepID=UPI002B4B95D6|nr:hypothetical protein [Chthonomonas sp.]HLI47869.1 hypothetical protein [Chthonomonas sp.]
MNYSEDINRCPFGPLRHNGDAMTWFFIKKQRKPMPQPISTVSQQRTQQQTPIFLEIIYAVLFAVLTEIGLQFDEGLDITGHHPVPLLSIAAAIAVYLLFNRSVQEGTDAVSLSQTGLFRISLLLLAFSLYSWVGKDPGFAAVLFLIMPVVYALSGPFARSKSGGSLLPLGLSTMMVVEFLLFEIQNPLPILHKTFDNLPYYFLIVLMMLFAYIAAIGWAKAWEGKKGVELQLPGLLQPFALNVLCGLVAGLTYVLSGQKLDSITLQNALCIGLWVFAIALGVGQLSVKTNWLWWAGPLLSVLFVLFIGRPQYQQLAQPWYAFGVLFWGASLLGALVLLAQQNEDKRLNDRR